MGASEYLWHDMSRSQSCQQLRTQGQTEMIVHPVYFQDDPSIVFIEATTARQLYVQSGVSLTVAIGGELYC